MNRMLAKPTILESIWEKPSEVQAFTGAQSWVGIYPTAHPKKLLLIVGELDDRGYLRDSASFVVNGETEYVTLKLRGEAESVVFSTALFMEGLQKAQELLNLTKNQ